MEGSASVRKSLSGTLVPSSVTTVAVLEKPEGEDNEKQKKKVLDDDEYVEVSSTGGRDEMLAIYNFAVAAIVRFELPFSL